MPKRKNSYYDQVAYRQNLFSSWRKVYSNGLSSKSIKSVKEIKAFDQNIDAHIKKIKKDLNNHKFVFQPSFGHKAPKKDGFRPLVISPLPNRIVQRAVLNKLSKHPSVKEHFSNVPYSYGGIKGKSVKDALFETSNLINSGNSFYIRADIKDFFTKIPRAETLEKICIGIRDQEFIDLLDEACKTELDNLNMLGGDRDRFPIYDEGVAQGSSLSPFLANSFLREFDDLMNKDDVYCLRFIDDFLLLGKNESSVRNKFNFAIKYLQKYGMDIFSPYDKDTPPSKADHGLTRKGLEFLGCIVSPDRIYPTKQSRKRIISTIKHIATENYLHMTLNEDYTRKCFSQTVSLIENTLQGWGKQYNFSKNIEVFKEVDKEVTIILDKFTKQLLFLRKGQDAIKRNFFLGVSALQEMNFSGPLYSENRK